jgi:hypothetical protein
VRAAGVFLLLLGLLASVVGLFSGCGSLFSWNGRHAIDVQTLPEGPSSRTLVPEPGRRYTLSVQVVFDREGLTKRDGVIVVEAKMPLVVRVKDPAGTTLAEVTGWLDPNEPPNVLFGQTARESMRGPTSDLYVERSVGPCIAASATPVSVDVDLGPDRVDAAQILARRLVIHDDALPSSIRNAFVVAAGGVVAFVAGLVIVVIGWFRRRSPRARALR